MQGGIGAHWLIETLRFTLLVEETVLVALGDEEVELEVTAGELHTARDGRPLAEGDGLVLGGAVGQCVTTDDILLEHVAETFFIACRAVFFANLAHHLGKQPLTASLGIVGQDVDAITGTHGNQALELPFHLGFNVLQKGKFATEDFDKEIPVAAGGFEEAAVEPERLIAHQVEHGVHLAWIGEHLAMVSHPLAAFDLGLLLFLFGHKKTANFLLSSRS